MRLLRPESGQWWEILPVIVACWAVHCRYVWKVRRAGAVAPRFHALSRRSTWRREAAALVLALLAGGAIVLALLRPQAMLTERTPEYEREDLVLMLDRSASMRAHDIRPSRFMRASFEIQNFLQHKPDGIDRVGLVGFAGSSVVLSYLTSDVDAVSFYLDWIQRDPQTLLGTDIGAALKSAMDVARKDTRPSRKVFLVLSDGEDHGVELARQIGIYRAAGLRIHCIGIGSDDEVSVPAIGPNGRETYLRDEGGRVVKTRYEEATLRRIASETGGRYLRSTTGGELVKAIDGIAKGERRIHGWKTTTAYRDLYPASLAIAAVACAALWLIL